MDTADILPRIALLKSVPTQVRWCDESRLKRENDIDVSPGEYLNRCGWIVIGTTIGGNAIAISDKTPAICFADHSWYSDGSVSYQDHGAGGEWRDLPMSDEAIEQSLFVLADNPEQFVLRASSGQLDEVLDRID
jgi:hypothetical protein